MDISVKEALHKIIDEAPDSELQEIYNWINEGMPKTYQYAADEIDKFYRRLELHEENPGASCSVKEAHELIRKK